MPTCRKCGKKFSLIDFGNHMDSHLTLSQWVRKVKRMQEQKRELEKPLPPDEVVFRGFLEGDE